MVSLKPQISTVIPMIDKCKKDCVTVCTVAVFIDYAHKLRAVSSPCLFSCFAYIEDFPPQLLSNLQIEFTLFVTYMIQLATNNFVLVTKSLLIVCY